MLSLLFTISLMEDQSFVTESYLLPNRIEFFDWYSSMNYFSYYGLILWNNYKGNGLMIITVNIYRDQQFCIFWSLDLLSFYPCFSKNNLSFAILNFGAILFQTNVCKWASRNEYKASVSFLGVFRYYSRITDTISFHSSSQETVLDPTSPQ